MRLLILNLICVLALGQGALADPPDPTSMSTADLAAQAPLGDDAWEWERFVINGRDSRFGKPRHPQTAELWARVKARTLTPPEWKVYLDRLFEALPDQWAQLLDARDVWPKGMPIECRPSSMWFMSGRNDLIVRLRLHDEPERTWHERQLAIWPGNRIDRTVELGMPPLNADSIRIDVQLLAGATVTYDRTHGRYVDNLDPSTALVIWTATSPPIPIGGTADWVMKPVFGPELDSSIKGLFPCLRRGKGGAWELNIHLPGRHPYPAAGNWALGVRCEVLDGDRVAATGTAMLTLPDPGIIVDYFEFWTSFPLEWIDPADQQRDSSEFIIRLTGDPAVAARDRGRSLYWDGQVEVSGKSRID